MTNPRDIPSPTITIQGEPGAAHYRYSLDPSPIVHPPCRRPGARTLGGWRGTLLAPERALDVLLGGDAPPDVLTPETRIACGLLAARLGALPAAA